MTGIGDVPNFTFTIAGVDHLTPPYYIEAIRASTNRLRYYVDNPFFGTMARAMVPYTGILLEADAVGYHIAYESRRVYAASCIGNHTLSRSTLFGPMPDVAGTLDIPRPLPGASTWTTRAFRQHYEFIKATTDIMKPRDSNESFESTAVLWDTVHTVLQKLLTPDRVELGIRMIVAAQEYASTNRPAILDGYLQTREDPNSFVNFVDGTFAHVWRDAREARRYIAASQRLWQTIVDHRLMPIMCPVSVMMQSRGRSITFTPLMPIHGEVVDNEAAPMDMLRLLSALIGNTGGHHRFGQAQANMTENGDAEEIADATDQPLAATAHTANMYCGADGYYYITRPTAFGIIIEHLRGGKTIAVPYAPLRLEAYPRIFPDGLAKERGWTANAAVGHIVNSAFEPVVKTLVKRAKTKVTDLVQRGFISALFRQYGLNIRFAFLVLKAALAMVKARTPEEMAITDALEAEMLCRALKTMYRADVAITAGVMTDADYLERANRLLYYVNSGSRPIWEQMSTVVRGKFIGCPNDYSIPPTPKQARILTWYMTPKMGFNFNAEEGLFDKVATALPVWYGCYTQPEAIRLTIAGKNDAAAAHLGTHWQWLEGVDRPPVMDYQRAVEIGRWKKINAHLAPEDPTAQVITEDGHKLDITLIHQQHRVQVFELLSHSVRVLSLTRLCGVDDEVVRLRLVKVMDTALRYRNTNSPVFAHLCSLLIDYLSFEAREATVTHPITDIFEDTCRTVYFYGTRLVQSMCVNFAKIQGVGYEGTRAGNLFFVSQALLTAGGGLTRDCDEANGKFRPYSAAVREITGVATDAPPLYDYPMKARTAVKLSLKASRGAQYLHAGMTLKFHYHFGRLMQVACRVLSRPRIEENDPTYIDFRVNPDLMTELLALAKDNISLQIVAVGLLTHQAHTLGSHMMMKTKQRQEIVQLSTSFFSQKKEDRRFITDDLFVGLSMAAFQYQIDIPCCLTDEERYSDAEVVTAFTRLLAASLITVEQTDDKVIKPIVECHKAVNRVYPVEPKKDSGLFFSKADFDMIKSAIQSPQYARNLSIVMDDVLLVRRMWVVLNTIRLIYYKGGIIYDKDEDLDEAVSVVDWCNKMADVQRAYAYRRLNGRFPDDTVQRHREIEEIKARLVRDKDLYSVGIDYMEMLQRHKLEKIHLEALEDATRRTFVRESEEWCCTFHKMCFDYKQTIGVTTCQMEEINDRNALWQEECQHAETLFRAIYSDIREGELLIMQRRCDTTAAVMYCDYHIEPLARHKLQGERLTALAHLTTTTHYCYCLMPSLFKDGYMRDVMRSYEECIVYPTREGILAEEAEAFDEAIDAFNKGYYGAAMEKLIKKESDLRRRFIIHERVTFNAAVFTPIEAMSRQLVESLEHLEWLQQIEHPQQVLTDIVNPEMDTRNDIEEEERAALAMLLDECAESERYIFQIVEELGTRVDTIFPLYELCERYAKVTYPCYDGLLTDVCVPMETEGRLQLYEREYGTIEAERFWRRIIADELLVTERDILYQMAVHRMLEVVGKQRDAEFFAIYERYQIESGQFRAADYEAYEDTIRGDLEPQYLLECVKEIVFAKCTDYAGTMMTVHTRDLLIGTVAEETFFRQRIEDSVPAAERELYVNYMINHARDLAAREVWERSRFMAAHDLVVEEYDSRCQLEELEGKLFYATTMAFDLLLAQLKGLDAIASPYPHSNLLPFVSRHWRRVVAEQKHADNNAASALPYDKERAAAVGGDKYGGPMLYIIAQRECLKMMRAIMIEPEYDEIKVLMEEAVRRNEVIEWYGHFTATARAEFENTMILMVENANPDSAPLLPCIPTAASINVVPLLIEPAHVVSRITGHARRLVLTAAHELQTVHDEEAPERAALAKRHRELVIELRKPPHRRSKRILQENANTKAADLSPILESGLLPIPPREVPEVLKTLSLQHYQLLKLLLYEDTVPVEATLRLRMQITEHRAAMGLYKAMKEEAMGIATMAAMNAQSIGMHSAVSNYAASIQLDRSLAADVPDVQRIVVSPSMPPLVTINNVGGGGSSGMHHSTSGTNSPTKRVIATKQVKGVLVTSGNKRYGARGDIVTRVGTYLNTSDEYLGNGSFASGGVGGGKSPFLMGGGDGGYNSDNNTNQSMLALSQHDHNDHSGGYSSNDNNFANNNLSPSSRHNSPMKKRRRSTKRSIYAANLTANSAKHNLVMTHVLPLDDLSHVPKQMIVAAKAIAESRYYHTVHDDMAAIAEGASVRLPHGVGRGGGSTAAQAKGGKKKDNEGDDLAKSLGRLQPTLTIVRASFDASLLPKFRVYEDVCDTLPIPGYTYGYGTAGGRPLSGIRRPGSGARRGTANGSRPSSASRASVTIAGANASVENPFTSSGIMGGSDPHGWSSSFKPVSGVLPPRPGSASAMGAAGNTRPPTRELGGDVGGDASVEDGHLSPTLSAAGGATPVPGRLRPLNVGKVTEVAGGGGGWGTPQRAYTPPPLLPHQLGQLQVTPNGGNAFTVVNAAPPNGLVDEVPNPMVADGHLRTLPALNAGASSSHAAISRGADERLNRSAPAMSQHQLAVAAAGGGSNTTGLSPLKRLPHQGRALGPRALLNNIQQQRGVSPAGAAAAASGRSGSPTASGGGRGTVAPRSTVASLVATRKKTTKPQRLPTLY